MTKRENRSVPQTASAEDPIYHNTYKLLKIYRDVTWSMELACQQVRMNFETEYGTSIDDFLESVYLAGADFGGTEIESHARSIERSRKMLKLIDSSVDLLRRKHKHGEIYYWVLYYSFLCPQELEDVPEILEKLEPHIHNISYRTYYRRRQDAIEALGSVLWGYANRDCLALLDKFYPEG